MAEEPTGTVLDADAVSVVAAREVLDALARRRQAGQIAA